MMPSNRHVGMFMSTANDGQAPPRPWRVTSEKGFELMVLFLDMVEYQLLYDALRTLALNHELPMHDPIVFQSGALQGYLGGGG